MSCILYLHHPYGCNKNTKTAEKFVRGSQNMCRRICGVLTIFTQDITVKSHGIDGDNFFITTTIYGNGKKIALVKVITANNVEGWSRLDYLYPEEYAVMEFEVQSVSDRE